MAAAVRVAVRSDLLLARGVGAARGYASMRGGADAPHKRPTLRIRGSRDSDSLHYVRRGSPWILAADVDNTESLQVYSPCLVNVESDSGVDWGVAAYTRHSSIAARILSRDRHVTVEKGFFLTRLERALQLRQQIYPGEEFYRLVNAEGDHLPGIVVDRYGSTVVLQVNAAGLDDHIRSFIAALDELLQPAVILLRNDSSARGLERLPLLTEVFRGPYRTPTEIRENGVTFLVSLLVGERTGWFYDQRDNRALLVPLCKDKTVLDLYSYVGAFGIQAAAHGARHVTCVDSLSSSIDYGSQSAQVNMLQDRVHFVHAKAERLLKHFADLRHPHNRNSLPEGASDSDDSAHPMMGKSPGPYLSPPPVEWEERVKASGHMWDVIIMDPPPLSPQRKVPPSAVAKSAGDMMHSQKRLASEPYAKLLTAALQVTAPNGLVFISSAHRDVGPAELRDAARRACLCVGRTCRLVCQGGASADHPQHLALPGGQMPRIASMLVHVE
ncbi:unnamed protein product [Vitrella brassicaformis CCMP3155]|uniref:RlmI-like PUA domain-containing protein n=1 Tax=Vitrella brassicaformis (strain CCMP3155) TaxID=1169540 RepID=A0A0G4EII6_VITBC|nr:unnamed protein product [Vitrella brassicaformis CCMP3155]|eukprot:CEL96494.1 unnamed protein product [Vitrella brassicaformis CCMP3155]